MADAIPYDQLGAAVYRAFTGRSIATEARDMPTVMRAVERAIGGPGAAARAAGVHPSTWRRWRAGTQRPGPRTRDAFFKASRHALMPLRRQEKFESRLPYVKARAQISSDDRVRELDATSLDWNSDGMADVIGAYLDGGSAREIGEAFAAQVGDGFYRGFFEGDSAPGEIDFLGLSWEEQ